MEEAGPDCRLASCSLWLSRNSAQHSIPSRRVWLRLAASRAARERALCLAVAENGSLGARLMAEEEPCSATESVSHQT